MFFSNSTTQHNTKRMRVTTYLCSVDNNPHYYKFIPYQIEFWSRFGIRVVIVFVGAQLPDELVPYKDYIALWPYTPQLKSSFVGQNIRIYFPALLPDFPDDEAVMIGDIDMLPCKPDFFLNGLESYGKDDFLTYAPILWKTKEIFMWYNSAHPETWAKIFKIHSVQDAIDRLNATYVDGGEYHPGGSCWFIDQYELFKILIPYPNLIQLNRNIKRLEMYHFRPMLQHGLRDFVCNYDDAHFHRSFIQNEHLVYEALRQLSTHYPAKGTKPEPVKLPILPPVA